MRERIRHHASLRLALQPVVADRGCDADRAFDIARIDEVLLALGVIGPHAGQAIGLQFDPHLDVVGLRLAARGLLQLLARGRMPSRFWM